MTQRVTSQGLNHTTCFEALAGLTSRGSFTIKRPSWTANALSNTYTTVTNYINNHLILRFRQWQLFNTEDLNKAYIFLPVLRGCTLPRSNEPLTRRRRGILHYQWRACVFLGLHASRVASARPAHGGGKEAGSA